MIKEDEIANDTFEIEDEEELLEEVVEERSGGKSAKRSFFWLQGIAFLLGVGLFVYVINRVGVQPIFDALAKIGLGFFIIIGTNGFRHVLRTISMSIAVDPEHRKFSFRNVFAARLGGETVTFLTFTGPLLGEATKAALLKRRVPLSHGVSALVVDNMLYNLSVGAFILSGALVMLAAYRLPLVVSIVLICIASASALFIIAVVLAARRRIMLLSWTIDKLAKKGFHPHFLSSKRESIYKLETNAYSFYTHRRNSFFAMLTLDFLAHATSVLEVYLALKMLGYDPQVTAAYIIESLTKVINFSFSFVPGTVGVYEGGSAIILKQLGYVTATGVALALVRKAAIIFWTVIGLLILIWRTVPHGARRLTDRYPRLQKYMDSLVFSNIAHRPARTAVSVFGIGIGVLLIVFTVGLSQGVLHERARREANVGAEIMARPSGSIGISGSEPFTLDIAMGQELQKVPGVKKVVPIGQMYVSSDGGFGGRVVDGIDFDSYAAMSGLTIREGEKLPAIGDVAIVDTVWKKEHNNAALGTTVKLYERDFKIIGFYEPPGGGRVKIPLSTMQDQVGSESKASAFLIACNDPNKQEDIANVIKTQFSDVQLVFTKDLPDIYSSGYPALNVFTNVVVGIAAAISMLVILLAMYTTVTERTRQIGILKSLGMSKFGIAWVIEQEAILVSALGLITGILLTFTVRFVIVRTTTLSVEINPRWVAVAFLVGLLGGTLGALYPALRAANQDAVEALSYE
jgi:putative ABC transport system permease protein